VNASQYLFARLLVAVVTVGVVLSGCSDEGDDTSVPPGSDASGDVTVGTGDAAGKDAANTVDATADGKTGDAAPDAPAAEDATVDSGEDASADVSKEAEVDAARDASADAAIDAAEDAAHDAPEDVIEEPLSDGGCYPWDFQCQCNHFIAATDAGAASATCSQTELTLFEKDTTGGCLRCAFSSFCLDDTSGDHGQECEDLASTTTAPNGANQTDVGASAVGNCQATLACEVGVNRTTGVAGTAGVDIGGTETLANAFCGTVVNSTCQGSISTSGINGACDSVIETGLPSSFTVGSSVLSNIANTNYSAGQAGSIVACLINAANPCTTCLE
jgi:hypothetical protein